MRSDEFIGCTFQPSRDLDLRGDGLIIRSGDGPWAIICREQRFNFREENLELKLFDKDGRLL